MQLAILPHKTQYYLRSLNTRSLFLSVTAQLVAKSRETAKLLVIKPYVNCISS